MQCKVQYDGVLGLDGYEHSKPIIAKNSLEQFEENYVFTSFSPEQNYWGSTELDIPAKIVKEDVHTLLCSRLMK